MANDVLVLANTSRACPPGLLRTPNGPQYNVRMAETRAKVHVAGEITDVGSIYGSLVRSLTDQNIRIAVG